MQFKFSFNLPRVFVRFMNRSVLSTDISPAELDALWREPPYTFGGANDHFSRNDIMTQGKQFNFNFWHTTPSSQVELKIIESPMSSKHQHEAMPLSVWTQIEETLGTSSLHNGTNQGKPVITTPKASFYASILLIFIDFKDPVCRFDDANSWTNMLMIHIKSRIKNKHTNIGNKLKHQIKTFVLDSTLNTCKQRIPNTWQQFD